MGDIHPRALVVEDNEAVRSVLQDVLAEWGFEVVGVAASGQEGVDLAAELDPSVVVMDFRMPAMDGLEATRRVLEVAPATRVVVISASEGPALAEAAAAAGAFAYVPKGSAGDLRRAVLEAAGDLAVAARSSARRATGGRRGR